MLNQRNYLNQLNVAIKDMLEYKNDDDACGYKVVHVKRCQKYIKKYLRHLSKLNLPSDQQILKAVQKLVMKLNKLNEATDYSLIETEVREEIWEIIQNSALDCGLKNANEDITEEWREW